MSRILLGSAATLVFGATSFAATPAWAQAVNNPNSTVFVNVLGPYVAGGQTSSVQTRITNGVVSDTSDTTGGSTIQTSHSANNSFNRALVTSNTGNTAIGSADLATASVHGYVGIGNGPLQRGGSQSSVADTIFFTNTTASTILLPYSFRFDGSITPTGNFVSNATASLALTGGAFTCPDGNYGTCGGDTSLRLSTGGTANMTTVIGYASDGTNNAVQQGGAFFFNAGDNTDLTNYSVFKNWNNATGVFDTIVSATLAIPTGQSRLGYKLSLSLDCSQAGSVCDFGNTSLFGFDPLPQGLAVTSSSGVFQTRSVAAGAVPEPATWAMLVFGFGLMGAAVRRRPAVRPLPA